MDDAPDDERVPEADRAGRDTDHEATRPGRSGDRPGLRADALPLTYDECRARFRLVAEQSGHAIDAHPITARGPFGQELSVDVVTVGALSPRRALVVLSGVHGVEGFVGSALQADLLAGTDPATLPADVGVVVVHAVNPWGMAHDRRQNESNVDLNRNWGRDRREPDHNDAYDEVHAIACPDTPTVPPVDALTGVMGPILAERGAGWVREAITRGQYRHPDGLHFGGDRTEESTAILERVLPDRLASATRVLIVDLHTGHGPYGSLTALSDRPRRSDQDRFLRAIFPRVEATAGNPEATTRPKSGPIARGIAEDAADAIGHATTIEVGTASDAEQLAATYQEQWVHRRGDPDDPAHRAIRRTYRGCFTPDDPAWEADALRNGREHLRAGLDAVANWT